MNAKNKKPRGRILVPVLLLVLGLAVLLREPLMGIFTKATLTATIEHAPVIMPAAYKVYANEDALEGKYSLFKMLLTNNSSTAAHNVNVSFEMPGFVEWRSIQKVPVLLPGQSVVVNCFPPFDEKIVERTTASKERVNIKIEGANIESMEESFPIEVKGRNEYMYTFIPVDEIRTPGEFFDNTKLVSCFVTPEDPIIKYFTQKIQEKILKGEDASVTQKPEEAVRFMGGIYNATYLSHMVYSGTSGVPGETNGVASITQSLRLPREVVTGKTGLCIELSILYASIMMSAGLDPVIFFIPGHAYPGFKMNGQYYAIEATGIGGEGLQGRSTAEQAFQRGMKQLEDFIKGVQMGDDRFQLLDIREAIKEGAVAMELKDDPFLRQKVDEIAQSFEPTAIATNAVMQQPMQAQPGNVDNGGGGGGGNQPNDPGVPAGYKSYNGVVSFAYPSNFASRGPSQVSAPQLQRFFIDPSNTLYLEVYQFAGVQNPEQAMRMLQQHVANHGGQLQYSAGGQAGNFSMMQGQTEVQGMAFQWMMAFKPANGGLAALAVGALSGSGGQHQQTITNILNSLK